MKTIKKIGSALLLTAFLTMLPACGAPRIIVKRTPLPVLPLAPTVPKLSTFKPVEIVATFPNGDTQLLRAMDEEDFKKILKELREMRAWINSVRKLYGEKPRKAPEKVSPPKRLTKPI